MREQLELLEQLEVLEVAAAARAGNRIHCEAWERLPAGVGGTADETCEQLG
jgi:hypothetical protein